MKLFLFLSLSVFTLHSAAFGQTLNCVDHKTFAAGKLNVTELRFGSEVSLTFYSVELGEFAKDLGLRGTIAYPSVELRFPISACSSVTVPFTCSGTNVAVEIRNEESSATPPIPGTLESASVSVDAGGLSVDATRVPNMTAHTLVPLTNCQ